MHLCAHDCLLAHMGCDEDDLLLAASNRAHLGDARARCESSVATSSVAFLGPVGFALVRAERVLSRRHVRACHTHGVDLGPPALGPASGALAVACVAGQSRRRCVAPPGGPAPRRGLHPREIHEQTRQNIMNKLIPIVTGI